MEIVLRAAYLMLRLSLSLLLFHAMLSLLLCLRLLLLKMLR